MTEDYPSSWPPEKNFLKELYWRQRLSLKQIGALFERDASAVLQLMRQYGIQTRNLSEAMTKYSKTPFSGDRAEKSYLLGLRAGDLYTARHGKCIRVTVSTTHPAMIELMRNVFGHYGRVVARPKYLKKWDQFEWEVYSYLHSSFEFLLGEPLITPATFLWFFAGFFDAEGTISIGKQHRSDTTRIGLEVSSSNHDLLDLIHVRLHLLGYHPCLPLRPSRRKGDVTGYGPYNEDFRRLSVGRKAKVMKLLYSLPIRHREKVMKKDLAIQYHLSPWSDIVQHARELRQAVRTEVRACVDEARRVYLNKRQDGGSEPSPVV